MKRSKRLKILYILSKKILNKYHTDVIGITGSIDRTATKESVCTVLSNKFNVRKNTGNFHDDIKEVPLTIIGVDSKEYSFFGWLMVVFRAIKLIIRKSNDYPDILVLEINARQEGDISYFAKYITCRFGVVTDTELIQPTAFTTAKKLVNEQEILVSHLSDSGIAVLNIDDKLVNSLKSKAKTITFGIHHEADITASEVVISLNDQEGQLSIKGLRFKLNYKGSVVPILIPNTLSEHQVYSALVSIICGLVYQMNLSDISNILKSYNVPNGRMRLIKGIKNTLIIDDSFDSSRVSSRASLRILALIPTVKKAEKYALLGDISGLGKATEQIHREIGHYVLEMGIDKLITVGEKSKEMALAAREAGMLEDKVFSFADIKSAGSFIQDRLEEHDIVLIKGSPEMKMEKIVKELMANPLREKNLLVRRKRMIV